MISRLTALAVVFAIVTTASLATAARVTHHRAEAAKAPVEVVVLQPVMVTAHRSSFSN